MKSILDKSFKYTPSYATDLSRRVQEHLREVRRMRKENAKEVSVKVATIKRTANGR